MKPFATLLLLSIALAFAATAAARPPFGGAGGPPWGGGGGPPGGMGGAGGRPFLEHVFPPPLVMQNQERLKLTDAQRTTIRTAMQETHAKLVDVQWRLDEETEKLTALLAPEHPDEAAVLTQVDKVLAIEQEMKKAHLRLLVRIKDHLTPEQQATLRSVMAKEPGPPPPAE